MLLFDFDHIMKLRIGLTESQVFVQYENRQVDFDINESGILWEDVKSGMQIQLLNDREKNKNIDQALLVLKGTCTVSDIPVASPFLVGTLRDNLAITSVGRSIVLKYPL